MKGKAEDIGMKRLCSILLALLLLLGACSGEESKNGLPQENLPIGFSGVITMTRGTGKFATAGELKNVGVFAYFTHGKFNENTAIPNFMYNQLVEKQQDERTWSYSPVKFWPDNSTTDKISFFAYAPYVNEVENGYLSFQDEGTASGFPVLGYTVPIAVNNQIDFLAATPVMNQNNGNVTFKLHHTLTKVNVYIKSNDNTEGKSVTSFSITGMKSGLLTYYNPTADSDIGWKWTYPSADEKENFTTGIISFPVPDTIIEEKKLLATFFLLPAGAGSKFNISYQYTAKDSNNALVVQTVSMENLFLPLTDNWASGRAVSYTIGIARKAITVMPENGPVSWEENTETETVIGTEEKQETD